MARLSVAFFLSGFGALLCQIVWQRMLGIFAGSDSVSAALVVGAFLSGLGLGSIAGARLADRISPARALLGFALAELGVGGFALLSKAFLYDFLATDLAGVVDSPAAIFALCFAGLVLPTTLMGASLPLLARAVATSLDTVAERVGAALRPQHARRGDGGAAGRLVPGGKPRLRGRAGAGGGAEPDGGRAGADPLVLGAARGGAGPGGGGRRGGVAFRGAAAVVHARLPVGLRDRRAGDRVGAAARAGRAVPCLPVPDGARHLPARGRAGDGGGVAAAAARAGPAAGLLRGAGGRLRPGGGADPGTVVGPAPLAAGCRARGGPRAASRGGAGDDDGPGRAGGGPSLLPDRDDLSLRAARGPAGPGERGRAGGLGAAREHPRQRRGVGGDGAGVLPLPGHGGDAAPAGRAVGPPRGALVVEHAGPRPGRGRSRWAGPAPC